ncbi:MAG: hypothetical protein BroJett011_59360 [Chloroflexota bacterium]|nr:MAG: hypothetical protein BroJett011_59360 [Chloroflexota bacterium]
MRQKVDELENRVALQQQSQADLELDEGDYENDVETTDEMIETDARDTEIRPHGLPPLPFDSDDLLTSESVVDPVITAGAKPVDESLIVPNLAFPSSNPYSLELPSPDQLAAGNWSTTTSIWDEEEVNWETMLLGGASEEPSPSPSTTRPRGLVDDLDEDELDGERATSTNLQGIEANIYPEVEILEIKGEIDQDPLAILLPQADPGTELAAHITGQILQEMTGLDGNWVENKKLENISEQGKGDAEEDWRPEAETTAKASEPSLIAEDEPEEDDQVESRVTDEAFEWEAQAVTEDEPEENDRVEDTVTDKSFDGETQTITEDKADSSEKGRRESTAVSTISDQNLAGEQGRQVKNAQDGVPRQLILGTRKAEVEEEEVEDVDSLLPAWLKAQV